MIENFVRASLHTEIDDVATEIRFTTVSPWRAPVTNPGGLAYALLLDDPKTPTRFEIVSYTRIEFSRLRGVTRGVNGTTAQSWPAGAQITQDLPEELIRSLGVTGAAGDALVSGASSLESRAPDWKDIAGKPVSTEQQVFEGSGVPATPATGSAKLFLNSGTGQIEAVFSSGTRVPVPWPAPSEHPADSKAGSVLGASTGAMTKPDNVSEGDMILACVVVLAQSGTVWTAPAGFTTIASVGNVITSGRCFVWMGYKVAGASEPSTYSFGLSTSFGIASWEMRRITGFSATTPIRGTATADSNPTAVTSLAIGSVTHDRSLLVSLIGGGHGTPLNIANTTQPSGMTLITKTDATTGLQIAKQSYEISAGSTGSKTWSFTSEPSQVLAGINVTINNAGVI